MKRVCFLFFLAILTFGSLLTGCSGKPVIELPLDEQNFVVKNGYVYVDGYGEAANGKRISESSVQEKAMARRAAILDAKRNFLRYIKKAKTIKENSTLHETLSGMIVDGTPVKEEIEFDQKIKVTYRFLLNGEKGLNQTINEEEIFVKRY